MTAGSSGFARLLGSLIALEDRTFALFHRIELKLRARPANGYQSPSAFERRVLRTTLCAIVILLSLLFVADHARRIKLLVMLLIGLFATFLLLSLLDAFPRGKHRPPNNRK